MVPRSHPLLIHLQDTHFRYSIGLNPSSKALILVSLVPWLIPMEILSLTIYLVIVPIVDSKKNSCNMQYFKFTFLKTATFVSVKVDISPLSDRYKAGIMPQVGQAFSTWLFLDKNSTSSPTITSKVLTMLNKIINKLETVLLVNSENSEVL